MGASCFTCHNRFIKKSHFIYKHMKMIRTKKIVNTLYFKAQFLTKITKLCQIFLGSLFGSLLQANFCKHKRKVHKDDSNRKTLHFEGPNYDRSTITEGELYVG